MNPERIETDDRPTLAPSVRFFREDDDSEAVVLLYGTFDEILRILHDLWWTHRRIEKTRLIDDWLSDRGLFDDEVGRGHVDDPERTVAALRVAQDHLARRADSNEKADAAIVALLALLEESIAFHQAVWVERA